MRYVDEFRRRSDVLHLRDRLADVTTKPWTIMEVCGGQTHAIVRFGLDQLLPKSMMLLHGPGCPVCVTPLEMVDRAIAIASIDGVIFCSFGDMLRVPGSRSDLMRVRAAGGDVRIVLSPLDALQIARDEPGRTVVFFAVGFETTAPAIAAVAEIARSERLANFGLLVSHVLVPPAIAAILSSPESSVDGFLAAGHVCSVMGCEEYVRLAEEYAAPIVVTGFEPVDIMLGIVRCVELLEQGNPVVDNSYARAVRWSGNQPARVAMDRVFRVVDRKWRGIGAIPASGLALRDEFSAHDAERMFDVSLVQADEPAECISGLVLQGRRKPTECPAFGTACTPEHPLGATMVSSEGACAAYHRYRTHPGGDA